MELHLARGGVRGGAGQHLAARKEVAEAVGAHDPGLKDGLHVPMVGKFVFCADAPAGALRDAMGVK